MSFLNANTLGMISMAGTAVKGVGQLINAKQEVDTGEFNAQVFQQKAEAQRESQVLLEQQKRRIAKSVTGTQVALYAKSGIKMSGSPLDVIADSLANANFDIAIDKYNSEVAARGFETEGELAKREAAQRANISRASAGGTFLSLAADIARSQSKLGGTKVTVGKSTKSAGIGGGTRIGGTFGGSPTGL